MISIFKKEWKSFFHSPLAYIYIAVVTMIIGIFFYLFNMYYGYPYFNYALGSLIPRLVSVGLLPLLTMRIFADETHTKSDQMLLTAPVKLWEIVIGKFLAVAAVFAVELLICCIFPIIIMLKGDSYYLLGDYLAILLYFLYGCIFIAMGLFFSSITEYTAVAAVLSFVGVAGCVLYSALYSIIPTSTATSVGIGCMILVVAIAAILYGVTKNTFCAVTVCVAGLLATWITNIVSESSLSGIYTTILEKLDFSAPIVTLVQDSVFSISGVIINLSVIFVFLMLTIQVLHKRRWN